ncbi:MAG: LysM peptidoglycan-binding domain-containing protein [Anaerolineae bacterium]|nr:LysM peptidoglycan-binding domain-containing protein [Anaerolineae bacterium]MCO5192516.1 LysM peptidoglycan-binding domain-containing protein [Anaerolineae bacterium]MCO5196650.1 LysM peptidoglycan-binding domain-containing protein [Anaerolineae bacterium]MCO5207358.1 LysM peptidoglycan-binding domain-containing protein [Anaerolineae bacterium]
MKKALIVFAALFVAMMLLVGSTPNSAEAQTATTTGGSNVVYQNYVVQSGDSLAKIARDFCTTWQEIYYLNSNVIGSDPNVLEPGTVLLVPNRCASCYYDQGATMGANGPVSGNVYTVVQGDTLYSIATRFGMSVETLSAANGITDPTKLTVGQKLIIPSMCNTTPPTTPPTSDVAATRSFAPGQCLLIPKSGAPGYNYPNGVQTTTFGSGGSYYAIQGVRLNSGQSWYMIETDPGSGNAPVWVKDSDVAKSGDCNV